MHLLHPATRQLPHLTNSFDDRISVLQDIKVFLFLVLQTSKPSLHLMHIRPSTTLEG